MFNYFWFYFGLISIDRNFNISIYIQKELMIL